MPLEKKMLQSGNKQRRRLKVLRNQGKQQWQHDEEWEGMPQTLHEGRDFSPGIL
jgi:hypothetical protein